MKQRIFLVMVVVLISACSSTPAQPPSPQAENQPMLLVPEAIGVGNTSDAITIVGPVWIEGNSARLATQLSVLRDPFIVEPRQTIQLSEIPTIEGLRETGQAQYGIIRATGTLSSTNNQTTLTLQDSKPIESINVTFTDLLDNIETYQNQVVTFSGSLIISEKEALLVEEVTPGGVPTTDSRQLKILQPFGDPELRIIGNSAVGVVSIQVTGLLKDKSIRVFWVEGL